MDDVRQKIEVQQFIKKWTSKGQENKDDRSYWIDILERVLGVENTTDHIEFQKEVVIDGKTKRIDAYIPETKVLIEQKSLGHNLEKKGLQSDGELLTPFEQADRYNKKLKYDEYARWIVTSNFSEIWIYDMNQPNSEPVKLLLSELEDNYNKLDFLVNQETREISHEIKISKDAGELVGKLYDAFLKQYPDPESEETLHSLNVLCVRLVFCLYAENSGLFGHNGMFREYMESFETHQMRRALEELFEVLDQDGDHRRQHLEDDDPKLASFPYVNGGLFSETNIDIPPFTDEIRELLLDEASAGFNWSDISPTIFGAVFESTLNPETRRSGGMHYTSIENIHKVIDPLFLDDLKVELKEICDIAVERTRNKKLQDFQKKLSSLNFLDPACGSGNFLTEAYLSLRRLENDALRTRLHDQMSFGEEGINPIQVSLSQFYGIEINDFAVSVAKTALWIAESQMIKETEAIVLSDIPFLPLKSYANIIEGNALQMSWEEVVPKNKLSYIMGNPPFSGKKEQSAQQKDEIKNLIKETSKTGVLDYVSGWFYKASQFMEKHAQTTTAFVSTDSLCQGEHVPALWKVLIIDYNIHISFAYKTFKWSNEASEKAEVYCIIVGITNDKNTTYKERKIYSDTEIIKAKNINPYLIDAPNIWLSSTNHQISGYSKINYGSMPIDGGHLILDKQEYDAAVAKEPYIEKYLKKYAGADELLKGNVRYCIWLNGTSRKDIINSEFLTERVSACRDFRLNSKRSATNKLAATPELFGEIRQPDTDMIVVPKVSSKHRTYVPIMLINHDEYIINGSALIIPDGNLYELGILSSGIHNIWLRAIAETWGHSYQYSTDIYNNFPFPPNEEYREKIEQAAQDMLNIRAAHADLTLSEMYSPKLGIISDLLISHQQIDKVVWKAYGFTKVDSTGKMHWLSQSESLSELMMMYQKLI